MNIANNIMKNGIIYQATSPSGKIYIGQTTKDLELRICQHYYHANGGLNTPFAKALLHYKKEEIKWEILHIAPIEQLDILEISEIQKRNAIANGYNLREGGISNRGPKTELHKANISKSLINREFSQTHCDNLSKSLKGRIPWNKGISRTAEEREKIRKTRTLKHSKKVLCITTGEVFSNITEAAKYFGYHRTNISKCIYRQRKTNTGLEFRFL